MLLTLMSLAIVSHGQVSLEAMKSELNKYQPNYTVATFSKDFRDLQKQGLPSPILANVLMKVQSIIPNANTGKENTKDALDLIERLKTPEIANEDEFKGSYAVLLTNYATEAGSPELMKRRFKDLYDYSVRTIESVRSPRWRVELLISKAVAARACKAPEEAVLAMREAKTFAKENGLEGALDDIGEYHQTGMAFDQNFFPDLKQAQQQIDRNAEKTSNLLKSVLAVLASLIFSGVGWLLIRKRRAG